MNPSPLIIAAAADDDVYSDDDDEEEISSDEDIEPLAPAPKTTTRLLRRWALVALCYVGALALAVGGLAEIMAAEHERTHGWQLGMCHIEGDFGHNDSSCIYFGTRPIGGVADDVVLCAVPASVAAAATSLDQPPACHDESADVTYWRSVRAGAEVECSVPLARASAVPSATCVAATTGGHSVTAIVWRMWIERLVYLSRTPREASAAIEKISAFRSRVGFGLLASGIGLGLLVTACLRACCRPPSVRTRRMAAHKMY